MKKIMAFMISFTMIFTMMPMATFAVTDVNEASVNGVEYKTIKEAYDAAKSGDEILLLSNVELQGGDSSDSNGGLVIRKSITINGQGKYKITSDKFQRGIRVYGGDSKSNERKITFKNVTITNNYVNGRIIDTRGGYFTLNVDNSILETTGTGNTQVVTVGGNHSNSVNINVLNNSKIKASQAGYGIVVFNPCNIEVKDSQVSGYAALYFKGPDSSIGSRGTVANVRNSQISSKGIAGTSNNFGTVVFEDENVKVNCYDSIIFSESDNKKPDTIQAIVSFSSSKGVASNNTLNINSGSKIVLDGPVKEIVKENGKINTVIINNNVECTVEPDAKYIVDGSKSYEIDGKFVIAPLPKTVSISESSTQLVVGETIKLTAKVEPVGVLESTVWSTSNDKVATCDDGMVKAVAPGVCNITVKVGEVTSTCKVTVYKVEKPMLPSENNDVKVDESAVKLVEETARDIVEALKNNEEVLNVEFISEEAKELLKDAKDIDVEVYAEQIDKEDVTLEDLNAIESKINDLNKKGNTISKIAQYLDLGVLLKADGKLVGEITELNDTIKFTVKVPEELIKENRNFFILRVHDGKVNKLETIYEDGMVSFETDKFSTYALAYEDVKVPSVVGNDQNTNDDIDKEPTKTGDNSNITINLLLAILAGASALNLILMGKKKKEK